MTRQEKIIWAAGFFDGEGCVNISKPVTRNVRKDGRIACYPGYQLQVVICQKSRVPMDVLVELFGGRLSGLKTSGSVYWWYRVHGKKAVAVLEKLLPYLILKKKNAELGIAFQNLVEATRPPRGVARDTAEIEVLEEYYQASRLINKRNRPGVDYTQESKGSELKIQ